MNGSTRRLVGIAAVAQALALAACSSPAQECALTEAQYTAIKASFQACDGTSFGQTTGIADITCAQVCCAFDFTACDFRAGQSEVACQPEAAEQAGTCDQKFAATWSTRCVCKP